jgi:hypothetical protein
MRRNAKMNAIPERMPDLSGNRPSDIRVTRYAELFVHIF